MGALDPAKMLVILVIALIVLGPERLPRAARQLGAAWHELTRIREQVTEEVRAAIPMDAMPHIPRPTPGSISGFVAGLTTPTPSVTPAGEGPPERPLHALLDEPEAAPRAAEGDLRASDGPTVRSAARLLVDPSLGEFAFLPDDPSMN